tara:strand:- start:43 stop:384 length:342 start_codon:yes stop_codon:yes gene_type:complete
MSDLNREVISKIHEVACVNIKGNEELIKAFESLQKENGELKNLNIKATGQSVPPSRCGFCDNYKKAYFELKAQLETANKKLAKAEKVIEEIVGDDNGHGDIDLAEEYLEERKG